MEQHGFASCISLYFQAHLLVGWMDADITPPTPQPSEFSGSRRVRNPKSIGQSLLGFQRPGVCFVLEVSAHLCGYTLPCTHIILIMALTKAVWRYVPM